MASKSSSIPPDRYGERELPQFTEELELPDGAVHPIEFSGRYARCTVHQGPTTGAMIGFLPDNDPPCVELARQWHENFLPNANYQSGFIDGMDIKLLCNRRDIVLAAMSEEVATRSHVPAEEASEYLRRMPELHKDPGFLFGHVDIQLPPDRYYAYGNLDAPDLLPYLRIANFPIFNLHHRLLGAAEDTRIRVKRECQVIHSGDRLERSLEDQAKWNELIAHSPWMNYTYERAAAWEPPPPDRPHYYVNTKDRPTYLNSQSFPIGETHRLRVSDDGKFVCTKHTDNSRCQFDIAQFHSDFLVLSTELGNAAWQLVTSRIVITDSPQSSEFRKTWLGNPSLWHNPDRLFDYARFHVRINLMLEYMINDIPPEIVHSWHAQTLYETHHIKIAEMFREHRPQPGYVATLALQWSKRQWVDIERSLPFNDDLPLQLIQYQEAGWRTSDISQCLHELELADRAGQLESPPPPAFPRRPLPAQELSTAELAI